MILGGNGGANTQTGLAFEGEVDFLTFIAKQKDYTVKGNNIYYKEKEVGMSFKKHGLYRYLEERGIRAFGPKAEAAIIEASKAFSKAFISCCNFFCFILPL